MALINPAGGLLGLSGFLGGQQAAIGQFELEQLARNSLTQQYEQNILASLQGLGDPRGRNDNRQTFGQALSNFSQNTPFANLGLSRQASAIGIQQARAPGAIAAANQGNFGGINEIASFFGQPGNFNQNNYSAVSALPFLGAQGVGAQLSLQQAAPFNAQLLASLGRSLSNPSTPNASSRTDPFSGISPGSGFNSGSSGTNSSTLFNF